MPEETALSVAPRQQFDLSPQTFEQALTFANYMADSDMVPKDFKGKPGNCLIAMQWGMEVGLKPLQALQGIAVINGRPSIWGDALLALVLSSPVCKDVEEFYEGQGEGFTAVCIAKRHGRADKVGRFSVKDAQGAGLIGKQGPWSQYRDRMLKQRARAFALRDQFADVIKGLAVAEEAMDTPSERFMGPVDEVRNEPAQYSQSDFEAKFPAWKDVIASGRKSAADLIAFIEAKGNPLTADQKKALEHVKVAGKSADQATDVQPKEKPSQTTSDGEILFTYAQVADRLTAADSEEKLAEAASLIASVADAGHRAELGALYERRAAEFAK
ncbi:hypothetical protein [Ottowia sp. VDI28]|uniref:hypothetical protein n=1 Tax=Ottowia sp. VDI28 TaxID=3133968 RepID=UPI003C2C87F2